MANSLQANKRARQAVKRRTRNVMHKTKFRSSHKKVVSAIASKDAEAARAAYAAFTSVADAVAGKGIVHSNKAARIKSRLNAAVRGLGK